MDEDLFEESSSFGEACYSEKLAWLKKLFHKRIKNFNGNFGKPTVTEECVHVLQED